MSTPSLPPAALGVAARSAQVQELIAAVKSGGYQPSPQRIAEQIVDAAELDARLRAMLGGG